MPSSVQEDDVKQETSSVRCTVLLIADPLVRFALKQLLRTAGEVVVVGEVLAEQAAAAVRQLSPDIALIDARRVDEDLSEFLRRLRTAAPMTKAIVLSEDDFRDGVVRVAGAGGWGYLPREVCEQQLARDVRLVAGGKAVMECAIAHDEFAMLGQLSPVPARDATTVALSQKEGSVIQAMAEGQTDSQIAKQLGVSTPTVKTHVRSILRKTHSRNRAAAIATAFRGGILR